MPSRDPTQHRNSQLSVLAQRRAIQTVGPFTGDLQGWNAKAARLRALADSSYSTQEDKALARLECGALLLEVRRRHTELQLAIKDEPPHSRLDEVDSAFRRIIDQLSMISGSETAYASTSQGVHPQDEQS